MSFPPSFLDEIRARVGLADLIGRRVKLTRKGREFSGLCPFHNEKTPSFTVSEEKGFFHCFGCGAHGDAIGFVMRTENLSFPEAVERLAEEAGVPVPETTPQERERERKRASLYDVMEKACAFFEKSLRSDLGGRALDYLRGRGLDDEAIARFRLGFAPDGRNALKIALAGEETPEPMLIEGGLLIKPDDGGASYDRFRNRVMFPITDHRGRVIAFGARALGDFQPKYLNSPDTPLFHKGTVLYGIATARPAAVKSGRIVVAEGYMDVIALVRAGIEEAVAPLGTALTESQLAMLWKLAPEPLLCFDGDNAGTRAAQRAAERALPLLEPGKSLSFVSLPEGDDPDTLIKAGGREAMEEVLEGAAALSQVIWNMETAGQRFDTPERVAGLEHRLEQRARAVADGKVQYQYLNAFRAKVRDMTGPARGRAAYRGSGRDFRGQAASFAPPPRTPPESLAVKREAALLAAVLRQPALLDGYAEEIGTLDFADSDLDRARQEILTFYASTPELDREALLNHLNEAGFSSQTGVILSSDALIKPGPGAQQAQDDAAYTETARLRVILSELIQGARLEEAQRRYEADPTEDNLTRLQECKRVAMESYRGNL